MIIKIKNIALNTPIIIATVSQDKLFNFKNMVININVITMINAITDIDTFDCCSVRKWLILSGLFMSFKIKKVIKTIIETENMVINAMSCNEILMNVCLKLLISATMLYTTWLIIAPNSK